MEVRTFFWHERIHSSKWRSVKRWTGGRASMKFSIGNAGDIFARDIIQMVYGLSARNVRDAGNRLLTIGSIAHQIRPGDIVCGLGTKDDNVPNARQAPCTIIGVRGPITLQVLEDAGHDIDNVQFVADPGLLIRHMVTIESDPGKGRTIFIPHYRERHMYRRRLVAGTEVIDIDQLPLDLAREIIGADLVYSSSLHGIIFAHSLGRPCVPIAPQTEEPSLKYEDYFASVGLTYRRPATSIHDLRFAAKPTSPPSIDTNNLLASFPSREQLVRHQVMEPSRALPQLASRDLAAKEADGH